MDDLSKSVPFLNASATATETAVALRTRAIVTSPAEESTMAFDVPALEKSATQMMANQLVRAGLMNETEAAAPDLSLEVVVGRSNLLPAWFLPVGAQRAQAVCKVEASGVNFRGQTGSWMGTGFLISDNILMTNCHVLNSLAVAANATCIFNFETAPDGRPLATKTFRANPGRLFLNSPVNELDCAFVWVDGVPGREFGSLPITRSAFGVAQGNLVNIIQHPAGRPKEVALQENQVSEVDRTVIHYVTDTEPGSSGSCVFSNQWEALALHHASRAVSGGVQNEGIRFTAIAAFLDQVLENGSGSDAEAAREILTLFGGTDETMGFFGSLGRVARNEGSGLEAVVKSFRGEAADIDVGFWNVEWFTRNYQQKVASVGDVIVRMNLDIWALVESSPNATAHLVAHLKDRYGLAFGFASSEPNAADGKQSTTVIWNKKTVKGQRKEWPGEIDSWFKLSSKGHEPGDFSDLGLEAVDGKIFNRYPGLFAFEALNRDAEQEKFNFFLVPLHLKAMSEGSKRRQLASEILAAAVNTAKKTFGEDDWVIGGDYNAELASGDFQALKAKGLVPLSASDEEGGAFSYLKSPKSLIDHVFLSANMAQTFGADDYFIVAAEKDIPDFVRNISDHRPVVVRLSLNDVAEAAVQTEDEVTTVPESLAYAIRELRGEPIKKAAIA